MVPGLVGWVGTLFCIRSKTLATMLCNLTIILLLHHNLTMASNEMLTCDEEKEEKEHVLRKLGQVQLLFPVTVKVHLFWRLET